MYRKEFDLGSWTVKSESCGETFQCFAAEVWECPDCASVIGAIFLERSGDSVSESDPVQCPACGSRKHSIRSAGYVDTSLMIKGRHRVKNNGAVLAEGE